MELNIFNIQHFCSGDGPGIRTTVFFGGCPLRCPWCHNPECFSNKHTLSMEDTMAQLLHDREFYDQSGGGVTLSGGEPLARQTECLALLQQLKAHGIHTAVDSSLAVKNLDIDRLIPLCDLFLVDIKTADPDAFRDVCGGELQTVLSNLDALTGQGANIVLRIPLIPGFNMDEASIDAIIALIRHYPYPVTLLPFHRMGSGKYRELGLKYAYADTLPPTEQEVAQIRVRFTQAGIREAII